MSAKAGTNPQPITFIGRDTGDEQVAAGYHTKGTLEGWIEAFNIIKNFPIPLFYLLVALSVPFMKWLECANKTVDNCKKTSTGKTISLANSASAYGKPIRKAKDTCLHVWDTTKVAIGRIMSVINDLPLFIDDTSKAPTPEIVKDAIYSVEAGRDKARGTIYGLAVTEWFTIMALTNGEQPAVSFTKNHAGAYARTLTIQEAPFGNESNSRRVKRVRSSVEKNYGHVAPIVIQFIADHDADYGLWEAAYEDAKEFYSDKAEGNEIADRMSDLIALVATTAPLIFKAVPQMKLEKPIAELLEYIWQFLEQGAHEADRPLEAFKAFWDWAVRNQRKFFSTKKNVEGEEEDESFEPNLGWYGRWDETHKFPHIGVTRAALEKALKDAGYDLDAVIGAWADNGWIMLRRDGKRQRTVDIGKAKVGCYCFTFKTIDDVLGVKEEN